jgi:hypothetical protein
VRRSVLILVVLAIGGLPACKGKPPPTQAKKDSKKPEEDAPGTVRGFGWSIHWTTRDPKDPKRGIPSLVADAEKGQMYYDEGTPSVKLQGVRAKLYQEGKQVATLTAGQLEANREDRILIGTKGVTLISLEPEHPLTLTAESMEWKMDSSAIKAEGNAKIVRRATGRQQQGTAEAPRILVNNKTGDYELIGEAKLR